MTPREQRLAEALRGAREALAEYVRLAGHLRPFTASRVYTIDTEAILARIDAALADESRTIKQGGSPIVDSSQSEGAVSRAAQNPSGEPGASPGPAPSRDEVAELRDRIAALENKCALLSASLKKADAERDELREAIQTHSECVTVCDRCGHEMPNNTDDVCLALKREPKP